MKQKRPHALGNNREILSISQGIEHLHGSPMGHGLTGAWVEALKQVADVRDARFYGRGGGVF